MLSVLFIEDKKLLKRVRTNFLIVSIEIIKSVAPKNRDEKLLGLSALEFKRKILKLMFFLSAIILNNLKEISFISIVTCKKMNV